MVTTTDGFYLKTNNGYYIKNGNGTEIALVNNTGDATVMTLQNNTSGVADGYWDFKLADDSYLNVNNGGGLVNHWTDVNGANARWEIYLIKDDVALVDVTYQVLDGSAEGALLAEGTIACFVGDAYPAVSEFGVQPSYTSSTYYVLTGLPEADETVPGADETDPAGGVIKTLIYTNNFPFRVSSSFEDAVWYEMSIGASNKYVVNNGDATSIALSAATPSDAASAQWCFIGNAYTGFKIYNREKGNGYILSSGTSDPGSDGNTGGSTYPILMAETALEDADARYQYWDITEGTTTLSNKKGFFIGQHGAPSMRMNDRGGKLAYWTGGADGGSTFYAWMPRPIEDGYYYIKSCAAFTPQVYMYDPNDKGLSFFNSETLTPKYIWHATFTPGHVALRSSRGAAPGRGEQNAVYSSINEAVVCPTITFSEPNTEGATMHWDIFHVTNQTYYTKSGSYYNSATNPAFATSWSGTESGNDYIFEPVTPEDNEAFYNIHITAPAERALAGRPTLTVTYAPTGEYSGYTELFDGGFLLLTSAPSAEDFTVPSVPGYTSTVEVSETNINVVYTAIQPEEGKVYRLHGMNTGRYAYATGTVGTAVQTTDDPTTVADETTLYFRVEDGLLKTAAGNYVDAAVEKTAAPNYTYAFAQHGTFNAITLKPGSNSYLCDWTAGYMDKWNDNTSINTAWVVEEVKACDYTLTSAGVGTLYLGFDSYIPANLTAKYVQDNTTAAADDGMYTLNYTEFEGTLPAENGAVVAGTSGTYTFYESTRGATAPENNLLIGSTDGTVPSGIDIDNLYALGQSGDVVAFYPYRSTGETLTPNKAYLNTESLSTTPGVKGFIIGDATPTGLTDVRDAAQPAADVLYDLTGRRVLHPAKGLYIQNGKKVLITK